MDEFDNTNASKFTQLLSRWVTEVIIVAVIGGLAGLGGAWLGLVSKDHELKVKLVEIGIGILRADPKENLTPARGWAINVIEKSSGFIFSEEDKQLLLKSPLLLTGYADSGYVDTYYTDSATPSYIPKVAKPTSVIPPNIVP